MLQREHSYVTSDTAGTLFGVDVQMENSTAAKAKAAVASGDPLRPARAQRTASGEAYFAL